MTRPDESENAERVLVLAPTGADAVTACAVLGKAGITGAICKSVGELTEEFQRGAGALLISEEAITPDPPAVLRDALTAQPAWSNIPLIILTLNQRSPGVGLIDYFDQIAGKVTLLERPLHIATLVSTLRVALSARRRQYQVRDLLAQREMDLARVQSAQQEAERANQAKDRFFATLSHELRLPLTPVLLHLSALATDPDVPQALRDDLVMMKQNVELEARLIDDLLDLTRITRGKLSLELEPVNLHAQLRHAAVISRASRPNGATLELHLEATAHRVWGDRARLEQIFWNLLVNAAKFTPPEGRIDVFTRNDEAGRILVQVRDTGMGIEPEQLPHIFGAFQQGSSFVNRTFGGLGLGLAICKSLVEQHGGSIEAASAGRGFGATFTVTLPILSLAEHPVAAPAPVQPPSNLRILLVEDHESSAQILARLLHRASHHVVAARSMREAIEALNGAAFDIIISDLGLPDGSGIDLLGELRRRNVTCPAIALSGLGMDSDVQATKSAGFASHLVKPIDWQKLIATMASLTSPGAKR